MLEKTNVLSGCSELHIRLIFDDFGYAWRMSVLEGACFIASEALYTGGIGTVNRNLEYSSGLELHEAPLNQVWQISWQECVRVCQQTGQMMWGSNPSPLRGDGSPIPCTTYGYATSKRNSFTHWWLLWNCCNTIKVPLSRWDLLFASRARKIQAY